MQSKNLLLRILVVILVLGVVSFGALLGYVCWQESHLPPTDAYDVLVVLGCQVKSDGSLSLQLQYRLEAALQAYRQRPTAVIVCGGRGNDEPETEAGAMQRWLLQNGVASEDIYVDDTSVNTRQNLENALHIMQTNAFTQGAIVTSDYHVARAIALAEDIGMDAVGIGAKTLGGMNWVKNHTRESLSWVKYWFEKWILHR